MAHIGYTAFRTFEHISPALISLNWLRIPKRISFKLEPFMSLDRVIPALLHSRRRHAVTTTTALIAYTYRSSVDLQSAVAHLQLLALRYERPASSRHGCAITVVLQTAPQDISVFTGHTPHKLHVLAFYTCVDLAIISLFTI